MTKSTRFSSSLSLFLFPSILEVAISSVVKRASMQPRVYVFLSVRFTFFTRLATSGGKCETNGDTEELLLAVLHLEDCLGVITGIVRMSGDQSIDSMGKVFSTGACRFISEQAAGNDDKVTSRLLNEGPGWGFVIPMLKISASIRESRSSTLASLLWIPAKVS